MATPEQATPDFDEQEAAATPLDEVTDADSEDGDQLPDAEQEAEATPDADEEPGEEEVDWDALAKRLDLTNPDTLPTPLRVKVKNLEKGAQWAVMEARAEAKSSREAKEAYEKALAAIGGKFEPEDTDPEPQVPEDASTEEIIAALDARADWRARKRVEAELAPIREKLSATEKKEQEAELQRRRDWVKSQAEYDEIVDEEMNNIVSESPAVWGAALKEPDGVKALYELAAARTKEKRSTVKKAKETAAALRRSITRPKPRAATTQGEAERVKMSMRERLLEKLDEVNWPE